LTAYDLSAIGLQVSEAQAALMADFEAGLYAWNESKNLTRVWRDEFWVRHILDSLLFQDLIPQGAKLLDIGTGPGFPAWPLAWARPDLFVVAVDSNGKMLDFLRSQPLPNLKVIQGRAEELPGREKYNVVTGRALAPLAIQLELSANQAKIGGRVIPMRGLSDLPLLEHPSIAQLGLQLKDVVRRDLPGTEVERIFPVYMKTEATPGKFPRRWAEMKAKPLFQPATD
jgi:16S rRNA (guanine527-N7)-methyltransferase